MTQIMDAIGLIMSMGALAIALFESDYQKKTYFIGLAIFLYLQSTH